MVVWNVDADRTPFRIHHHAFRIDICDGNARPPHDGRELQQDRRIQRRAFFHMDASDPGRYRLVSLRPLRTRNLGPAPARPRGGEAVVHYCMPYAALTL